MKCIEAIYDTTVPSKELTCADMISALGNCIKRYGNLPIEAVLVGKDTATQEIYVANDDQKRTIQVPLYYPKCHNDVVTIVPNTEAKEGDD